MKSRDNRDLEILIVEDSPTQREQLKHLLTEHGYAVVPTANGKEALDAARSRRPALVISDVVMPELDGYGLSKALKSDAQLKDVPVILVTTLSDPQDVIRGLHCGADNFVRKPYDERYLISRIENLLMNRELRKDQTMQLGVELALGGETHFITAERQQILDLLISTYDQAVRINGELKHREAQHTAALDTLHDREEEFRTILGSLNDCVITIDDHGIIRSANAAVERVLGYAADELIGHNVSTLMPEPDSSAHSTYMDRYTRTGEAHIIGIGREVEGLHKNAQVIPLDIAVNEIYLRGERRFVGTLRDISERKRLIKELAQAQENAENANRAKSAFLAAMSHEIRTPMNGVVGMVEVLAHSGLSEDQSDMVKVMRDSAATLLALIDDILDFSKIEAGRLEIERAPLSVIDLVESLCNALSPLAALRNVDLFVFVSPEIPHHILSDEVRMRQVLYNLAGNAIKFCSGNTDKRGCVSIRVEIQGHSPPRLAFRVADNGIGMAPDTVAGLFMPFTQAEASTTRRFGGTGLGLTICKRLVELMQGEITVESTLGAGSVFTVTLPVEAATGGTERSIPDLSNLDCILVSGPDLNRDDLCVYLRHAGVRTHLAVDLDDAARRATHLPISVVIHDAWHRCITPDALHAAFAAAPNARHLLITRGWRRRARVELPNFVTLDGNALSWRALLDAVAVAAGRASPEISPEGARNDGLEPHVVPPTIAEARALGQLILVAEDDTINQKVILRQLGLLGYAAEVVNNGVEALPLWRTGDYALVLSDLHMPEMDGYTLTAAIRREEAGQRHTPVLALTANALLGEANRARAAGMDDYLTKPLQLHVLSATLKKWLPVEARSDSPAAAPRGAVNKRATQAVDVNVLRGLVGTDAGVVREFLTDYLDSARVLMSELREACAANEPAKVSAIAHKLKSSSRAVGALALGDLLAGLENACKAAGIAAISEGVKQAEAVMSGVEAYIGDFLARE
ncbi:MAG: response regulator [Gammaproteobacteria bacterium]